MDPSTSKFLQARAYAVLPCSSSLAALYASQTPKDLIKGREWCCRCGTFLLDGNGQTRVSRTKKAKQVPGGPYPRSSNITCLSCGHEDIIEVVASNVPDAHVPIRQDDTPRAEPTPATKKISPADSSGKSKSRKQNKSHLQALLVRNQKKTQEKGSEPSASGGLAAFLSGL